MDYSEEKRRTEMASGGEGTILLRCLEEGVNLEEGGRETQQLRV